MAAALFEQSARRTTGEDDALVEAAEGEWKVLILAGYYTGARLGDLSADQWESVDLGRGSIRFVQEKTRAKNHRAIESPIHPEFERWLSTRIQAAAPPTGAVFHALAGVGCRGRNGLSGQFSPIVVKARIKSKVVMAKGGEGRNRSWLTFHSLRHSFNSAMANAGVTQEIRQRLTGQASKTMNDHYTHSELETWRRAVDAVPGLGGNSCALQTGLSDHIHPQFPQRRELYPLGSPLPSIPNAPRP